MNTAPAAGPWADTTRLVASHVQEKVTSRTRDRDHGFTSPQSATDFEFPTLSTGPGASGSEAFSSNPVQTTFGSLMAGLTEQKDSKKQKQRNKPPREPQTEEFGVDRKKASPDTEEATPHLLSIPFPTLKTAVSADFAAWCEREIAQFNLGIECLPTFLFDIHLKL